MVAAKKKQPKAGYKKKRRRGVDGSTRLQVLVSDATANDSDKNFAVPSGESWDITYIYAELATTATAGNRRLSLQIRLGGSSIIYEIDAGAVQAASLTRKYLFLPGVARETAFADDTLTIPIPPGIRLRAADDFRVFDRDAVDAAADDLTVRAVGYSYAR